MPVGHRGRAGGGVCRRGDLPDPAPARDGPAGGCPDRPDGGPAATAGFSAAAAGRGPGPPARPPKPRPRPPCAAPSWPAPPRPRPTLPTATRSAACGWRAPRWTARCTGATPAASSATARGPIPPTAACCPARTAPWFVGGHTDSWFVDLKSAQIGGIIHLETPWGTFSYQITETKVIGETEIDQCRWGAEEPSCILYTCYPFGIQTPHHPAVSGLRRPHRDRRRRRCPRRAAHRRKLSARSPAGRAAALPGGKKRPFQHKGPSLRTGLCA